jgi:hypothetical protein
VEAHEALERFEHAHGDAHGSDGLARQAALVVAIIAAFLAIATFLGNEAVKEAIQGQTEVADARADANNFDSQVLSFNLERVLLGALIKSSDQSLSQGAAKLVVAISKDYKDKEVNAHQKELQDTVKEHQANVKKQNNKHLFYELAEVLLQIAIVLASVSIIAKRRFLLIGGGSVAAVGVVLLLVGYVK